MKLENEIKQKSFINEWSKALVNVAYTGNWLTDNMLSVLKPFDINDQHYNILRILRGRHPGVASPGEVKDVLVNKRGDLTRLLDKLVKKEMVERWSNEENRRMVNLKITQKGLDLIDEIDAHTTIMEHVKGNLTSEEASQLSDLLDKMRG